MSNREVIVKPESSNLWWGIYGFCEKVGWEDLTLSYSTGESIGKVCLNGKSYLRLGLAELLNDENEKEFVEAVRVYLAGNECHFWYYYRLQDDKDSNEISYKAPRNELGLKPHLTDIWHKDEHIGLSTIKSGVSEFMRQHVGNDNYDVVIRNVESWEDSLKSFQEHQETMVKSSNFQYVFTDELVSELSELWSKPKEEVLRKLERTTN